MSEQNPEIDVTTKIEIREAIAKDPGAQSFVLFVALFAEGAEVIVPLTPDAARAAAATMIRFANDIDGRDRDRSN
jgi:hypothetical protein